MDLGRWLLLSVLVLFFVTHLINAVEGNVVFQVHHTYGGRGKGLAALAALRRHDSRRHGRMLAAIDYQLGGDGSPTGAALYYTKITIGTPPVDYHVQVDTGSDILWVNCKFCDKCPTKSNLNIHMKRYDITASSTGRMVSCDHNFCGLTFGSSEDCKVGMNCEYSISYGDGSITQGYFVKDIFRLDQVTGNFQTSPTNGSIVFGCSAKQSGELGSSSQAVDGIIGFGKSNTSILSQLASAGKVKRIFSHCLDGNKGGGIFAVGEVVQPKVNGAPLVMDEQHYSVYLKAIDVGGQFLTLPSDITNIGSSKGAIFDSGTTLAYLPSEVYRQLIVVMMAKQPKLETHLVEKQFTCFSYHGNVDDGFPVVNFHFEGSLNLEVYPRDYLFQISDTEYCIGWQNGAVQTKGEKEIILLGDIALSDKLVVYDGENKTIGWTQYNCSSSITVKDEASGNAYAVGAHNISAAFSLSKVNVILLLMLIASLLV